jgi:hypothetical protein
MVRILSWAALAEAGVKIDEKFRAKLAKVFAEQTSSLDEKLSRIYDENHPDPTVPKVGRKPTFVDAHWETLRAEAIRLLDEHGGLSRDDPKFNSKDKLMDLLLQFAQKHHQFEDVGAPGRTTLQTRVNKWLEEWRTAKATNA